MRQDFFPYCDFAYSALASFRMECRVLPDCDLHDGCRYPLHRLPRSPHDQGYSDDDKSSRTPQFPVWVEVSLRAGLPKGDAQTNAAFISFRGDIVGAGQRRLRREASEFRRGDSLCSLRSLGNKIVTALFRAGQQLCKLGTAPQLCPD